MLEHGLTTARWKDLVTYHLNLTLPKQHHEQLLSMTQSTLELHEDDSEQNIL